jgi:hypothetical protein
MNQHDQSILDFNENLARVGHFGHFGNAGERHE